jgi:hypothetical protein
MTIVYNNNSKAFYFQASWGRLEMKPREKKKVQNKSKKKEKIKDDKKSNQKKKKRQ